RDDLYFRLNVITITLPPLRERREDIPLLVSTLFLPGPGGKTFSTIEPDTMRVLIGYEWPGNVRELANVLERAQILAETEIITRDDLPDNLIQTIGSKSTGVAGGPTPAEGPDDLKRLERRHVEDVLRRHGGNKVQAAKALGVSRRSLYRLIDKHQLGEA